MGIREFCSPTAGMMRVLIVLDDLEYGQLIMVNLMTMKFTATAKMVILPIWILGV